MSIVIQFANLGRRAAQSLDRSIPPSLAYTLGAFRPDFDGPWMDAMNGQRARQRMMCEVISRMRPRATFESGTFRGSSTHFLWHLTGEPVWTAELNRRFANYARHRFRHITEVTVMEMDSRDALRSLANHPFFPRSSVLFYLDAHWNSDLPLRAEVELITRVWASSVIVIDDFQVPADPGYGYDSYGETELNLAYLGDALGDYRVFWPAPPSELETGYRRGCVVLASPDQADLLKDVEELREECV